MTSPGGYCTLDDIKARYEISVIDRICFDGETESVDYTKLVRAIEDSAGEIDSYISTKYPVPVTPVSILLRNINIDFALYATALTCDKMFDELERRCDAWRKHLIMIAKGQAGLGIREDASTSDPAPAEGTGAASASTTRTYRV